MSSATNYFIATQNTSVPSSSTAIMSFAQRINVDAATNLNNLTLTEVPMDGAMITNQTGFAINGNGIQLTGPDTYVEASFVISVFGAVLRANMVARLAIDTGGGPVLFGPETSHGYIRNGTGHQQSSFNSGPVMWKMATGNIITVQTIREGNAGTVRMNSTGTSQLLLKVLKNV